MSDKPMDASFPQGEFLVYEAEQLRLLWSLDPPLPLLYVKQTMELWNNANKEG
ncbi:MAG: hypothetical protein P1P74_12315 [Desulfuromonadales bacterium]|nr:hypothetical protein [Desulfuromonadales bacterium]